MKARMAPWLLALSVGCMEPEVWREIEIYGEVLSEEEGPVELWVIHQSWGEGDLQTSFIIIDSVWVDDLSDVQHVLELPSDPETALSIYGWQDTNEDGEHCRPETPQEMSGLEIVDDLSGFTLELSLSLEVPCEGPEGL